MGSGAIDGLKTRAEKERETANRTVGFSGDEPKARKTRATKKSMAKKAVGTRAAAKSVRATKTVAVKRTAPKRQLGLDTGPSKRRRTKNVDAKDEFWGEEAGALGLETEEEALSPKEEKKLLKAQKKAEKKARKAEKKKKHKVLRVIRNIFLVLLFLIIVAGVWIFVLGNDFISRITGGSLWGFITSDDSIPLQTDENGRTNILIFGTEGYSMDDPNYDGGWLTDSILVASVDQENGNVKLVSLPRDLKSQSCTATSKINEI